MRSVFDSKCFLCSQVWESLHEEQKEVARRPDFEGLKCNVSLVKGSFGTDDRPENIIAQMYFDHGDDLYETEEYNRVGGMITDFSGQYAILDPCRK